VTFETMLKIILGEIKPPEGQNWVSLDDLKEMASKLDGNKK